MLNARQLAEWEAYWRLEPWGEARMDIRMARVCALLANINRNPKKRSRPWGEAEFLFEFGPRESQSADEMKAALMGLAGR